MTLELYRIEGIPDYNFLCESGIRTVNPGIIVVLLVR